MKEERISEHLQDSLIFLSITNDNFIKLVTGQIPEEFFSSKHIYETYKIICKYYKKFKKAPGNHFHDEIVKFSEKIDKEVLEVISRYLLHLNTIFIIPPDTEYVLSRLNDFIKVKNYIKATYQFADLVERGAFDEAEQLMQQTLRSGVHSQEVGIDFFSEEIHRSEKPNRLFFLNISEIDKHVRINRTDFITIAGDYHSGKSWFGHYIGYQAIRQGLNVLHVSHEGNKEDTEIRYDMMIGGLISHSEKSEDIEIYYLDNNGKPQSRMEKRKSVYNKQVVAKVRKSVKANGGGRLFIQKYPMGTCTVAKLDALIEQIEVFENIKIDVCINDYADIMCVIDTEQARDSINKIYIHLKSVADDRRLVMITMSQINEEGSRALVTKGKVEGRHLAEDKRKFGNIDKGFFIGTNPDYE